MESILSCPREEANHFFLFSHKGLHGFNMQHYCRQNTQALLGATPPQLLTLNNSINQLLTLNTGKNMQIYNC